MVLVLLLVVVVMVVIDGGARREAGGRFFSSGIVTAGPDWRSYILCDKTPLESGFCANKY
jgi:hypothetical protein